jgi:N-dimethylarginine dimethylaminohydrolase
VLLHRPGPEIAPSMHDPDAIQMLAALDLGRAQAEHDQMAKNYRDNGVEVHALDPRGVVQPNQMFCADLFAMTPQGAILARPASEVRAGEEVEVARRLAALGVPVLKTLTGGATFEGADLIWVNPECAILGLGLRTNREAAVKISRLLEEIGVTLLTADMPFGTMHLMGMLRIVDSDLAIAWPRRTPHVAVTAFRDAGYEVEFLTETEESETNRAFNFVTLGPRRILMVDGNPKSRAFYESLGIECIASPASELGKAAGAIGCLTGIVLRQRQSQESKYGQAPVTT